ncbi:MAG TPA: STAS domain-containing protein [Acidobacteriaceae bacterium]|nr:STAS domain-containing protein [Acidobacteriaceae bacterium]
MFLQLESRVCGRVHVLECKGRIVGGHEARALEAALDQDTRRDLNQVVLHVREVTRLDSIGLGLLVRYAAMLQKRSGGLRLAAPPPLITELLQMTRLQPILRTFPTEEDAILSFLLPEASRASAGKSGPAVLLVDQSGDFCNFAAALLTQHGYAVKSASLVCDAKILLRVGRPDVLLLGPSTPPVAAEAITAALRAVAPGAEVVRLEPEFKSHDAHEAATALLRRLQPAAS